MSELPSSVLVVQTWQVFYLWCEQARPKPKYKYVVIAHLEQAQG